MHRLIPAFGLIVMILLAWLLSSRRKQFPIRIVVGGLLLQFAFAGLILGTAAGRRVCEAAGTLFNGLLGFSAQGSEFMFGSLEQFAFRVLPTIIFFSALMSILYHLGIMQFIVRWLGWVMQRTLGTSGAESLSAASNVFVGQTEAPFVILPYIRGMTRSELMAVMVGGFATVAGGVMAAYVSFGIDAGHLLTASFISAPAGLLIAKILQPETETPETLRGASSNMPRVTSNLIEAATHGAAEGLKLALNVGAMLIAFLALIAMLDFLMEFVSLQVMTNVLGVKDPVPWTLTRMVGWLFTPLAWVMGIDAADCEPAGRLLGLKMVGNEFLAYSEMAQWSHGEVRMTMAEIGLPTNGLFGGCAALSGLPEYSATLESFPQASLSFRSQTIMTYALCGFSNFASIGIQVGGIGGLAPERRGDLAALGFRAMLGGTLACCMTACIAGILL